MDLTCSRWEDLAQAQVESSSTRASSTRAEIVNGFVKLDSNARAFESALLFASAIQPLVCVFGSSGWGKSVLIRCVARQVERRPGTDSMTIMPAAAWALDSRRGDPAVLVLEDAQDALTTPRARHRFRQALERRMRLGRPTMLVFTWDRSMRALRMVLPQGHDWLMAQVHEPSIAERELIVSQMAKAEGLSLANAIVRLIARQLHGNGQSIRGALQRLSLDRSDWSRQEDVLAACGVLTPHLADRDGWDPRDAVFEAALQELIEAGNPREPLVQRISAHLMLNEVGLSEQQVANYFSVSPGRAYALAGVVRRSMQSPVYAAVVEACRDRAIQALAG